MGSYQGIFWSKLKTQSLPCQKHMVILLHQYQSPNSYKSKLNTICYAFESLRQRLVGSSNLSKVLKKSFSDAFLLGTDYGGASGGWGGNNTPLSAQNPGNPPSGIDHCWVCTGLGHATWVPPPPPAGQYNGKIPPYPLMTNFHPGGILSWWEFAGKPLPWWRWRWRLWWR